MPIRDGEYPVNGITAGGEKWEAFGNSYGGFRAEHPKFGVVHADSYSDLEDRARKATSVSRVKVSVPIARIEKTRDGHRIVYATATGIHGGSGNVLALENGKAVQLTHSSHDYFMPPSEEDARKMAELLDARDKADLAWRALRNKYKFAGSLTGVVQAAVNAVREGEGR